jgi:hypothetical protein
MVLRQIAPARVRKVLNSLPTELYVSHQEGLACIGLIGREIRDIAMKALAWVLYAPRVLRLPELLEVVCSRKDCLIKISPPMKYWSASKGS